MSRSFKSIFDSDQEIRRARAKVCRSAEEPRRDRKQTRREYLALQRERAALLAYYGGR